MPNPEPLNYPAKWIFTNVEGKAKSLPFVMLIDSNQIIDSSCPKATSFKPPGLPLPDQIGLINMKVLNN